MQKFKYSELTFDTVNRLIELNEQIGSGGWQPEIALLSDEELQAIELRKKLLQRKPVRRLNEATVWSKAIYPILELVEREPFAAWAQFEMKAEFARFALEGFVDGVIGTETISTLRAPFFVVVEAKREIEARDPQPQLYGAMLAAAKLNWDENRQEPQIIHGCYTIGDSWTFLRGAAENLNGETVVFSVEATRDYIERTEAEAILGILKAIVAKNEQQ